MHRYILICCTFFIFIHSAHGWQHPGGDAGGQRYSPHRQINKDNVANLEPVWQYRFNEAQAKNYKTSLQVTPLYLPPEAGGHVVACSPFGRITALDPATGKLRWQYDPQLKTTEIKNIFKCRGVSYWQDDRLGQQDACKHRIYLASIDRRLIAVDALDGLPCLGFGSAGQIKLYSGEQRNRSVFSTSPPVIAGDNIIIGSQVEDFNHANMPTGAVLAYDVRSGQHRWSFSAIPEQNVSDQHWPANPQQHSGAANVWAPISVDVERNRVFVPTSAPSADYYGVLRPGDNGYANSLVALDADTGAVIWHFQFVHHDLWDYDTPSQPILTEIKKDGVRIPAVIQTTKQGLVFMFNRDTGEPIYGVEERPVAKSRIAGEYTSPTQPFPIKPAPLVDHRMTAQDAFGLTFWDRDNCRSQLAALRNEGIYTPFGLEPALYNPSALGGMNWGGASVSAASQILVVNLSNTAMFGQLLPLSEATSKGHWNPAFTQVNQMQGTPYGIVMGAVVSPLGIPCSPPPWGKLAAIDISNGKILWQRTLGSIHDMGPISLPFEIELGTPNLGGPLLTGSGLVFIGATMDRSFRAFDSSTGEKLWTAQLPFDGSAAPMTYMHEGSQYIVISAGGQVAFGRPSGDVLVAYRLPAP